MENTYREGQFVWRELMTSDIQKARGFYGELLGWTYKDMPMEKGGVYTIVSKGETTVGGMMQIPPGAQFPSYWCSYVSVKDVDATAEAVKARGGQVLVIETAKGVGRFGAVMDPQGGVIGVLHGETGDMPAIERPFPGVFCWETLNATDPDKAKAFYREVFGWSLGSGPGNADNVFKAGEAMVADVEPAPPGIQHAAWVLHVVVEKLTDATARAEKLGAKILMANVAVPQIGSMTFVQDPMGAVLSLFEPEMPSAS